MHKTLFDAAKLEIVQTTLLMPWFDIYHKLKKFIRFNKRNQGKTFSLFLQGKKVTFFW